jgi:hypothetical protein
MQLVMMGLLARSENNKQKVGAKSVSENLAYNYSTAQKPLLHG